jgi:hexaprenyl-diphosphate synthase
MLDFLPPSPELGKPGLGADLSLGLTTAPSLFAWQTNPALGPLIARKFSEPGDVERAREMVTESDGLEKTRKLAERFATEARKGVELLPPSEAREALIALTKKVVERVA